MQLKVLLEKRAKLTSRLKALEAVAEKEQRNLTAEEATEFDAALAEIETEIDPALARLRKLADLDDTGPPKVPVGEDLDAQTEETPFDDPGEFLHAVVQFATTKGRVMDERLAPLGMNEAVGSDGGFLVQKDFLQLIVDRMYATGSLLSLFNRIPISGNGIKLPQLDETSRANGSRFGGVRAYWSSEAGAATASRPTIRKVEVELDKIIALTYSTAELLEDTAALAAIMEMAVPEEISFLLEDAIVNGTGAGQPLGILNSGALISVAKESGQSAATIVYENIVKMFARLPTRALARAVWLINQDVWPALQTMTVPVGTGGVPAYLPPGGLSATPLGTLMGRPILPVEYCATLGTVGDIVLMDPGAYLLGQKGGIKAASSMHVQFLTDEETFRWTYRVLGSPTWNKAVTPYKGTSTVSPFVALATRA